MSSSSLPDHRATGPSGARRAAARRGHRLRVLLSWLAGAWVGSLVTACDTPARPPAAEPARATAAPPTPPTAAPARPAYALDSVRVQQDTPAALLTVQATYPRLRPLPGTAPADTAGVGAFNREAKRFVTSLVTEIRATARDNRRQQLSSGLRVAFDGKLLRPGWVSVAFTITQDGIGPRPLTWATGLTYNLRTGRKVRAADLFKQSAAFQQAVLAVLQPLTAENDDCELEPSNLTWDNFCLGPATYYLLLGDPQVGRACPIRQVAVPLAKLQRFASAGSPAANLP